MERHESSHAKSNLTAGLTARPRLDVKLRRPCFTYHVRCRRAGQIVWEAEAPNVVTDLGCNMLLDTMFSESGYTAAWYAMLVAGAGFTAYAEIDTMASHAGWTEWASYDEAARQAVAFGSAASKSKTITTRASYTVSAGGNGSSIVGAGLTTDDTKSGTAGTLYSVGALTNGSRTVYTGDTLEVGGTVTAASA